MNGSSLILPLIQHKVVLVVLRTVFAVSFWLLSLLICRYLKCFYHRNRFNRSCRKRRFKNIYNPRAHINRFGLLWGKHAAVKERFVESLHENVLISFPLILEPSESTKQTKRFREDSHLFLLATHHLISSAQLFLTEM